MTTTTAANARTAAYASQPCGHGEFCWHECVSRNMRAAETFYTRLLAATSEECSESPSPYAVLSCGGHPAFGLLEMDAQVPKDVPAHWAAYIAVDDLDAVIANVARLGGTVRTPVTDISIGRYSLIADPTGAIVNFFQGYPGKTDGVNWSGEGLVGWNELMSTDPKAAEAFYTRLLGWTSSESSNLGFPYWMFSSNGKPVAGLMGKCAEDKAPASYWFQYVQTADIDASIASAKTLGGTACCDPMEIPGIGRVAYFTDPNGAAFGLWQKAKSGCGSSSGGCCCG